MERVFTFIVSDHSVSSNQIRADIAMSNILEFLDVPLRIGSMRISDHSQYRRADTNKMHWMADCEVSWPKSYESQELLHKVELLRNDRKAFGLVPTGS